jgi:hypothetical protein
MLAPIHHLCQHLCAIPIDCFAAGRRFVAFATADVRPGAARRAPGRDARHAAQASLPSPLEYGMYYGI